MPPAATQSAGEPQAPKLDWLRWPRIWFGVVDPVPRGAYALSGFGLMMVKYGVEAALIQSQTGMFFGPLEFLSPVFTERRALLSPGPGWLPWVLFVWTLAFMWIAVSMSVRRAADAGLSPWLGLLVLAPLINLIVMLVFCVVASDPRHPWAMREPSASGETRVRSAVLAVGFSVIIGGLMLATSVYLLSNYGASLFLGTPLVMSAVASYLYNRPQPRGYGSSIGVGVASVLFAAMALLLFALEGFICVAMAVPFILPLGVAGGALGKAIADATRSPRSDMLATVLALPLLAAGESFFAYPQEYVVLTTVEIAAPPLAVWENVIGFPEITERKDWYFRWGIACPERAHIVGRGAGATRYCEFTTGKFVEPITAWEEGERLAFDVTGQPAPMFELSPYRDLHPPHLDGYLRSTHGEFLLTPLPDGGTRLAGRTWYEFRMFPRWYWTLWSDWLIHRIHQRVLTRIKRVSEPSGRAIHASSGIP